MRRLSLCFVAAFVLAFVACSIFDPEVEYWVVGTVRDETDGSPIPGATVEAYRGQPYGSILASSSTDIDGRYSFRYSYGCGKAVGFKVSAQGYQMRWFEEWDLPELCTSEAQTQDYRLWREAT
jgi:hypothetical protein